MTKAMLTAVEENHLDREKTAAKIVEQCK